MGAPPHPAAPARRRAKSRRMNQERQRLRREVPETSANQLTLASLGRLVGSATHFVGPGRELREPLRYPRTGEGLVGGLARLDGVAGGGKRRERELVRLV